jgi:hypothetical protein
MPGRLCFLSRVKGARNTDRLVGFLVVVGGDGGESWPWPGAEIPNLSSLTCCRFGQPADCGWVRSK